MTTSFDPPAAAVRAVVAAALTEDVGVLGDITSIACVPDDAFGTGMFVARVEGVLAGTAAAAETFREVDPSVEVSWYCRDGETVEASMELGTVNGPLRSILTGERVALNFLTHLSGVASTTRRYVRATHGKARIRDTRKTLPGLRALQKAAVRAGGGFNHRDSLSDAVLIKDNHLAATSLTRAVERTRARWPGRIVEVECENLEQVVEARDAGVDLIMLDNMSTDEVKEAVATLGGTVRVEVSGGIDLTTIGAYAETGADFIAVGAITHSARVLDIALDIT